jgi:hypothetical protein
MSASIVATQIGLTQAGTDTFIVLSTRRIISRRFLLAAGVASV